MSKSPNTLPLFRTTYDGLAKDFSDITATDFTVPDDETDYHPSRSLTDQAAAPDTDINNIMARYLKTGLVPQTLAQPFFGDASALPSFMEAQQLIIDAKYAFESLPSKVRDRFHNNPEEFLNFMGDPDNEAEARFLGLIEAPAVPEPSSQRPKAGEEEGSPAPFTGQE